MHLPTSTAFRWKRINRPSSEVGGQPPGSAHTRFTSSTIRNGTTISPNTSASNCHAGGHRIHRGGPRDGQMINGKKMDGWFQFERDGRFTSTTTTSISMTQTSVRCSSKSAATPSRGRDVRHQTPPAQIRTGALLAQTAPTLGVWRQTAPQVPDAECGAGVDGDPESSGNAPTLGDVVGRVAAAPPATHAPPPAETSGAPRSSPVPRDS